MRVKRIKEIRVQDIDGDGIEISLRCCSEEPFATEQLKGCLELEESWSFDCPTCNQHCEISYDNTGYYTIRLFNLIIVYKPGELICVSGPCYCQNNVLKDGFTGEICKDHCVDSRIEGEYPFICPCDKTHVIVVRTDHFHICSRDERPILESHRTEQTE
ncbi:MAG: hypothetical protein WC472_04280 [Candidatus Paceibacterota bacterium]